MKGFERPGFKDLTLAYNKGVPKASFILDLSRLKTLHAEPKYDGRWGILMHEEGSPKITLYSRRNQVQTTYEDPVLETYPAFDMHGEFIFGTNFAKNSNKENKVILFDMTRCGGCLKDEPLSRRRATMLTMLDRFKIDKLPFPFQAVRPITDFIDIYDRDSICSLEHYVTNPDLYEGIVIKDLSGKWGDTWYRIKPVFEMDYVIMGFNQSDAPKYKGRMVSSVKAGLYISGKLSHVCNVSGLNDKQRTHMYQFPNAYLGNVFTATGKSLFDSGALRHPNFLRLHPTKVAKECRWRNNV